MDGGIETGKPPFSDRFERTPNREEVFQFLSENDCRAPIILISGMGKEVMKLVIYIACPYLADCIITILGKLLDGSN